MTDCKHVIRYRDREKMPVLTPEQSEAGWMVLQDGTVRWGPCIPCLQDRIVALEGEAPADGASAPLARIGGTAVVRIECDPQLGRALETLAPVIGPLLARWLGVGNCIHGVRAGAHCAGCYGPARAA